MFLLHHLFTGAAGSSTAPCSRRLAPGGEADWPRRVPRISSDVVVDRGYGVQNKRRITGSTWSVSRGPRLENPRIEMAVRSGGPPARGENSGGAVERRRETADRPVPGAGPVQPGAALARRQRFVEVGRRLVASLANPAECTPLNRIVRFTPESCRGHQSTANPLWANSGRAPQIKKPPTGDLSAT